MKYTFKLSENKNTSNNNNNFKSGEYYSKILDNLIYADIIDKNPYLFETTSNKTTGDIYLDKMIGLDKKNTIKISSSLKDAIDFADAANFLANYNKIKTIKLPYEYGKTYELADGTPIIFFDDSIQIGFDLYYFNDFSKPSFIEALTPSLKKTIATIYINGLKITIKN